MSIWRRGKDRVANKERNKIIAAPRERERRENVSALQSDVAATRRKGYSHRWILLRGRRYIASEKKVSHTHACECERETSICMQVWRRRRRRVTFSISVDAHRGDEQSFALLSLPPVPFTCYFSGEEPVSECALSTPTPPVNLPDGRHRLAFRRFSFPWFFLTRNPVSMRPVCLQVSLFQNFQVNYR